MGVHKDYKFSCVIVYLMAKWSDSWMQNLIKIDARNNRDYTLVFVAEL